MIRAGALLLAILLGGAAPAAAPETSLHPAARPVAEAGAGISATAPAPGSRPAARPQSEQILAAAARPSGLPLLGPDASLLPFARPDSLAERALFERRKRRKGSVCGDLDIQGDSVGHVSGRLPGCGAKDAVRVREIAGVRLSQAALMTCNTARALKTWINREVETAFGRRNRVVSLRVAAHYACRTRNNRPGARISEHGKGRAIDISGFTLASGETVTVLKGWQTRKTRRTLKKVWRAACGPFGTVLGPEADRYHRDHFHLDVARHRGGSYCR
ncbi:extensin family protein [Leisingera methylohalidivorans]|uniref:Extensin family protein n=1 Tax=Leisingera methylohalidivorans DSM 14336 TaxID=999552 RepID=V9VN87_9RHOB|nr:extensin family protein [Leisingera methylohalidivorans]AHD00106.1 extensin family protein [Leisingera methylohalidivorans DSM 14336]